MHPILAHIRHLALYLAAALTVGALVSAGLEAGGDRLWPALLVFLPATLAYALLCLSSWYICRAFPLTGGTSLVRLLFVHALASTLASSFWGGATNGWARLMDGVVGGQQASALLDGRGPAIFLTGALVYWLGSTVHYLIIALETSREAERRSLEHHLLAKEAELKALRAQIDPHFMFNSLHSISALTSTDPAAARRMALLLADFLRETLRLGALRRITLAEEFALVERFVGIEQVRLGARLRFERVSADDVDQCLVPPLILQPLVENAVVHGVAELVEGGRVVVRASRTPTLVTLVVENPCDPDRPRSRGVGLGLELLRRRVTTQYGVADAVESREENGWFRVELRLPVERAA